MPDRRELAETAELYREVVSHAVVLERLRTRLSGRLFEEYLCVLPSDLMNPVGGAVAELLQTERYLYPLPEPAFSSMTLGEFTRYRALLFQKQYVIRNEEAVLNLLMQGLGGTFLALCADIPKTQSPSPFTIPLIHTLANPKAAVAAIFWSLITREHSERGLFSRLSSTLHDNLCRASGRDPKDPTSKKPLKYPIDSELPLSELVDTYLAGTPYQALLSIPVPLKLTHEDRFSHMHIVGGTGAGKTSLIERLIVHDFMSDDTPSLVIIDPHGDLISRLTHANLHLRNRFVLISPRDTKHPPALNVFAQNRTRLGTYDEATREQVTAGVIQTFDYLFSGLIGADLTAKQGVFFRYVARLMLSLPETMGRNATILDMMRLMQDATPYQEAIEKLPEIPREFFLRDFPSKTFAQTKEQIRYRIQAIIENPTLARLFTSPETKIDLFEEMNRGSIILVDTAKDFLKDGSASFGKIFISLVLQAILERAAIPEQARKPTFLIVDEAASFFDSNMDDLLTEARKYKCGCVFAHQYLDQASHALRASLAANTVTKFAAGLSSADARFMAADMRTTPDFILNQPKLTFAAHIRNITPHAVSIPVVPGILSEVEQLSPEAYEAFIVSNRARVSLPLKPEEPRASPHAAGIVAEEASDEW